MNENTGIAGNLTGPLTFSVTLDAPYSLELLAVCSHYKAENETQKHGDPYPTEPSEVAAQLLRQELRARREPSAPTPLTPAEQEYPEDLAGQSG